MASSLASANNFPVNVIYKAAAAGGVLPPLTLPLVSTSGQFVPLYVGVSQDGFYFVELCVGLQASNGIRVSICAVQKHMTSSLTAHR